MWPRALAAGIVLLATACSNPSATLIATGGTTASGSSSSSSGTGTTTGGARFSCDLGDGGLFGDAITVSTGLAITPYPTIHPMDVGDLNGDGNLDIVVAERGSPDVAVLFGNGDGTFQQAVYSQVPADNAQLGPVDLHIAAMGSPAIPSVVMWNSESAAVLVETVQPTGGLNQVSALAAGQRGFWGYVQVADFNRDGIVDCAVMSIDEYPLDGGGVTAFLGHNSGGYSVVGPSPMGGACLANCFGDFNDDGILDLLVIQDSGLSVLPGNGDGTFANVGIPSSVSPGLHWALGDVNEDGHLDVLTWDTTDEGAYGLFLGRGDGTFTIGPTPIVSPSFPEALHDLNGDGHLDYVSADPVSYNVLIALGNGDGTFQPTEVHYVSGDLWQVVVGDVNNDGRPDLIVSHSGDGNVTVFLNNCR